jgi:hypothetical protein
MAINPYSRLQNQYRPQAYDPRMMMLAGQRLNQVGDKLQADLMASEQDLLKVNALAEDKGRRNELTEYYEDQIEDLSNQLVSGNINIQKAAPQIMALRKNIHQDMTRGELGAINTNYAQYNAYVQELKDNEDLSASDRNTLISMARDNWGGTGQTPTDGEYNMFTGREAATIEDSLAKQASDLANGWMSDKVMKGVYKVDEQGMFINVATEEYVDPNEVYNNIYNQLASDPQNQAFVSQQALLRSYRQGNLNDNVIDVPGEDGEMEEISLDEYANNLIKNAAVYAGNKEGFTKIGANIKTNWMNKAGYKQRLKNASPSLSFDGIAFNFNKQYENKAEVERATKDLIAEKSKLETQLAKATGPKEKQILENKILWYDNLISMNSNYMDTAIEYAEDKLGDTGKAIYNKYKGLNPNNPESILNNDDIELPTTLLARADGTYDYKTPDGKDVVISRHDAANIALVHNYPEFASEDIGQYKDGKWIPAQGSKALIDLTNVYNALDKDVEKYIKDNKSTLQPKYKTVDAGLASDMSKTLVAGSTYFYDENGPIDDQKKIEEILANVEVLGYSETPVGGLGHLMSIRDKETGKVYAARPSDDSSFNEVIGRDAYDKTRLEAVDGPITPELLNQHIIAMGMLFPNLNQAANQVSALRENGGSTNIQLSPTMSLSASKVEFQGSSYYEVDVNGVKQTYDNEIQLLEAMVKLSQLQ